MSETLAWILFNVFVVAMLGLDLGVIHRHAKTQGLRQALAWSGFWITLAAGFAGILYATRGPTAALDS